jgi:hypothetical protein
MRQNFYRLFISLIFLISCVSGFSQEISQSGIGADKVIDSLKKAGVLLKSDPVKPVINLTRDQSMKFLQKRVNAEFWTNMQDPLRVALDNLIFQASHEKFDSTEYFLRKYPYDSLQIPWDKFYVWSPLSVKIPYFRAPQPITVSDSINKADSSLIATMDSLNVFSKKQDSISLVPDVKDSTLMVIIDTLNKATSNAPGFPFRFLENPYQSDSLKIAVETLLDYLQKRDSSVVFFTGTGNSRVPVWLNSQNRMMRRYWLKNEFQDSVTIWIGNENRNTFGLYLEQGVNFRKPTMKQGNYSEAKIFVQQVDNSKLHQVKEIQVKKQYWKYRTESSLVFSQSALSNWVKGGENSISTALDVTGYADFNRPELKLTSSNFARLKLGFLKSGDNDIRKNLDLLETNSKLNHKAFGKFDFSGIMLFKTQIAVGKSYGANDTSWVVSRFLNPAVLTIGFGLDYKPNKETSINFSPLSYKGTFVPAAGKMEENGTIPLGKIDQTLYGVPVGKKSLNEPGASFMISKISHPFKNLTMTNRLQLFTNYINNPQNIDVDWEMIAVANLNWFTDLRFNTHLIFDDDTRTPELDKNDQPKLREDGTQKKTARIQFKEMMGLSLVFRF